GDTFVEVYKDYGNTAPAWESTGDRGYDSVADYAEKNLPGDEMGVSLMKYLPGVLFKATESGIDYSFTSKGENENDVSNSLKVTVENGKVTKIEVQTNTKESHNDTVMDCSTNCVVTISKFGAVTVTVPNEVKAVLNDAQ
ncbi:MAG: hypothetical protein K2L51_01440, partial [Clostridiales bacterium]|nr:hypothetical protein [Clostridiales bacterium]